MEEHAQQTTEDEAAGIRSPQFPLERLMVTNHRGCGSLVLLNDVLARCPSLQHLSLHGPNQIEKAALSLLQSGYLTCLTSLKLGRREGMTAGYELLKAIPPHQLRELIFTSPVPHFTFEAIAKLQSRNLEHLELIFHEESTHDMMALFSKCSALRSLRVMENRGSIVDIRDVLHEPWACLLLEDLKVPFRLPNSVDNTEHEMQNTGLDDSKPEILEWQQIEIRFMKQLGALTRLRRLDMSNDSWYCPFSTNEITWCLDVGLEYLVNLSQLEVLDMSNRIYIQGIPEFQWMKEHLKSLSKLVIHRFTDEEKFEWFRTHWPSLKVYEA
ncbi:hypothetical protein BGZ73_001150 [Actinomortierella ambigua]|nr:hypothetical protein BGZ73_001150 [Actinomortierella ambigua]